MRIIRAETRHIDGILALLRHIASLHHQSRSDRFKANVTKYSYAALETFLQEQRDDRPVFVAEEGGVVVGHCFCQVVERTAHPVLKDGKTLYIDDFCVDEAHQRRGVGRLLLDAAEAYARTIHAANLELNVWAFNESAIQFYNAVGFDTQKIGMEKILH